ncbi:hypothetical protein BJV78DRAFT_145914 [Lactifluus subvellereus]|nr:hypothetical protein BJV78DRAFT_145914 [Lactifluus subvellereus]
MLSRQQNHDISEKFVLGFTELTLSKESMLDLHLFNQELLSGSFGGEESSEKPLFHGRPHGPRSPGLVMHCPHTSSRLSEVRPKSSGRIIHPHLRLQAKDESRHTATSLL